MVYNDFKEGREDRMATKYGIELRKIRLVRKETLQDMADKVGLSISYMSAIENGFRKIPKNLTKKILEKYNLNDEEIKNLKESENESIDEININLLDLNSEQKNLAFLLSRKLPELDNVDELIKIILKDDADEE